MANPEHVEIVKQGRVAIKFWRAMNPRIPFDLHNADLSGADLNGAKLSEANLCGVNLSGSDLRGADFGAAYLFRANLSQANLDDAHLSAAADLRHADLSQATLRNADLGSADLGGAKLKGADLSHADLYGVNLSMSDLRGANFDGALVGRTVFAEVDLSKVKGLESVRHGGPSSIGIDTLYKSQGGIPEAFLRGCGVPHDLIALLPKLIGAMEPIQFQSCFISYSSKDDEFARLLYDRMLSEKLSVFFAPKEMRGGKKFVEQIDQAIKEKERLLLVLSESSLKSEWVKTETRKARRVERSEGRRKLFPIRLVSVGRLEKWKCLATDPDEDLAAEVRSYHIPDFSNWKDHDAFEVAFADLLRDLRAEA